MQKIAQQLGINKKITTYLARHTFSTVLKRSGGSTEYIQEAFQYEMVNTIDDWKMQ